MEQHQNETNRSNLYELVDEARRDTARLAYGDIVVLDSVQIRRKLNSAVVNQYLRAYETNHEMPPLVLLRLNEQCVLVDGYHRYHAIMRRGCLGAQIPCHIIEDVGNPERFTLEDAKYLQYYLNSRNGLRLNKQEVREGWRRYFEAKMYRLPGKHVKSLREIGREFGVAHTTIRNFISRNFKNLTKLWKREDKWIDRDCNNPEGINGFCRTDKSKATFDEILLDIRKIKGKSQLVKPGSYEHEEMCEAIMCLYDLLKSEGTPRERLLADKFLQDLSFAPDDF
jgi:hypothetical protein